MASVHTAEFAETQNDRLNRWFELIRRRSESGMPIRRFCKLNSISEWQYRYWRQKLSEKRIEIKQPASFTPKGWAFVASPKPERGDTDGAAISIEFDGFIIRAGANADVSFLARTCRELRRTC